MVAMAVWRQGMRKYADNAANAGSGNAKHAFSGLGWGEPGLRLDPEGDAGGFHGSPVPDE